MKKIILSLVLALLVAQFGNSQTWIQKSNYPGTIPNFAPNIYFKVSNAIYVLNEQDRTLWKYNPVTDNWIQKSNFPGPQRSNGVTMTIGSNAYYGTGQDGLSNFLNDFWEYTPATDSWVAIDTIPENWYFATAFSVGNKGYVLMGLTNMVTVTDRMWEYDPSTSNWSQKNTVPFTPRYSCNGLSAGTSAYVGLGYSDNPSTWYDDLYEYDQLSDSWATLNPFPYGSRCQSTATSDGSKIYVGLGNLAMTKYSDMYSVDVSSGNWSTLPSLPGGGRTNALGYVINGILYMGLGTTVGSMNDLWALDVSSGIQHLEDASDAFWYPCSEESIMYVFKSKIPKEVLIYDLAGKLVITYSNIREQKLLLQFNGHGTYFVHYIIDDKPVVQKVVL